MAAKVGRGMARYFIGVEVVSTLRGSGGTARGGVNDGERLFVALAILILVLFFCFFESKM